MDEGTREVCKERLLLQSRDRRHCGRLLAGTELGEFGLKEEELPGWKVGGWVNSREEFQHEEEGRSLWGNVGREWFGKRMD